MNYGEFGTTDGQKALEGELHMRKTKFCAGIAVAAMLLVGIAGWANSNNRVPEAQASTGIGATQLDTHHMMLNAKNLPATEIEDFSLVFPSRFTD